VILEKQIASPPQHTSKQITAGTPWGQDVSLSASRIEDRVNDNPKGQDDAKRLERPDTEYMEEDLGDTRTGGTQSVLVAQWEVASELDVDGGYINVNFILTEKGTTVELMNPYILLCDDKISKIKEVMPILEQVNMRKRSLLIVAADVDGEALATLIVNQLRRTISVAAIRAPAQGKLREAILEDIATFTGGTVFYGEVGENFDASNPLESLGTARFVSVGADITRIASGGGDRVDIEARIKGIQSQLLDNVTPGDRKWLKRRIENLIE